ncbi:MAG: hypothetical protein Q4A28_04385 [Brachymonas sp.]|nr:hypothetical protein [Brachymonas sp.]
MTQALLDAAACRAFCHAAQPVFQQSGCCSDMALRNRPGMHESLPPLQAATLAPELRRPGILVLATPKIRPAHLPRHHHVQAQARDVLFRADTIDVELVHIARKTANHEIASQLLRQSATAGPGRLELGTHETLLHAELNLLNDIQMLLRIRGKIFQQ